MNRVTRNTPIENVLTLFARDGYVLLEDALTGDQIADLSAACDERARRYTRPWRESGGSR